MEIGFRVWNKLLGRTPRPEHQAVLVFAISDLTWFVNPASAASEKMVIVLVNALCWPFPSRNGPPFSPKQLTRRGLFSGARLTLVIFHHEMAHQHCLGMEKRIIRVACLYLANPDTNPSTSPALAANQKQIVLVIGACLNLADP
jgi:hypothetical protein